MILYSTIKITDKYNLRGYYECVDDKINFNAFIIENDREILYKSWSRKIFGDFNSDQLCDYDDPKLIKIANTLSKMGNDRINIRIKSLLCK